MLLHTQTKHNVNNMYFYCNNCPNFICGQNYYRISNANYWVRTIIVTSQLTEALPPREAASGLQMDNNQQKRVVVFIRRPVGFSSGGVHPCQAQWHGCLFRVFGKRAHPLMCKASAARWPPWPAAGGGRTPCAQCAGAAPARSGPLTGTTGKWRSDRHKDRNIET